MSVEPSKFHIGVIDIFSILLPGAILVYHVHWLTTVGALSLALPAPVSEAAGWTIFLVAAYIVGHFVFVVSSCLDLAYDAGIKRLVPRGKNGPLLAAIAIKTRYLQPRQLDETTINAFQWAKCRLALAHPAALLHVEKFEADSKFFRSLVVVLLITATSFALAGYPKLAIASFVLMAASAWRYGDQRFKSTRQAYWYLVALESSPSKSA